MFRQGSGSQAPDEHRHSIQNDESPKQSDIQTAITEYTTRERQGVCTTSGHTRLPSRTGRSREPGDWMWSVGCKEKRDGQDNGESGKGSDE